MTAFFADTSFYVALTSPADAWHAKADEIARTNRTSIVTTEHVLTEVANLLSGPTDRAVFLELIRQIDSDPNTEVVGASPELWRLGLVLFAARPDKEWSLTDCISFEMMRERGLTVALSADHHFEQAGFTILLK